MTVHAAKGMEFKHVFIPFLRSGTFPHRYQYMSILDRLPISWQRWDVDVRDEKKLHIEEERRLFYVALTRAEKQAYLTYTQSRYRWGKLIDAEPSRFIEEIEDIFDLLEEEYPDL